MSLGTGTMFDPIVRSITVKRTFDAVVGRRMLRRAAGLVVTSTAEARRLSSFDRPFGKLLTRPVGIDPTSLLPLPTRGALRQRLRIPARAPLVLSLGRIARKKHLTHLVEAIEVIPEAFLLIAGPDSKDGELSSIRRAADRLGVRDRLVILSEGLWGADKAQALADSDAFCLPSENENFGVAPAEAAAAGLPVVISDRCGVGEWLDPTSSRVVGFGDLGALRSALREVLFDPRVQEAASEAAPAFRQRLTWTRIAADQLVFYEKIMDGEIG
jgi:glycosyltransferase involved in cell wall biosynthesis